MRKLSDEERMARVRARKRAYYAANLERLREFHRKRARAERRRKPEHVRARSRAAYKRNPWPARRWAWRRYGIDVTEAEQKLRAHNGRCDLCGTTAPGGAGGWHVDHDHRTLKVRGILCVHCNHAFGAIDKVGVPAIRNYIRRHGGTVTKKEASPPPNHQEKHK